MQKIHDRESQKIFRFRKCYLMCVKQEINFGDPVEDKANIKRGFTCNYSYVMAIVLLLLRSISALPGNPLRYITDKIEVMLSSYITCTSPGTITTCL